MHQRFIAPGAYVQGAGVLESAGEEFATLDANRAYVLGGKTALSTVEGEVVAGLSAAETEIAAIESGVGTCTHAVIDEQVERVRETDADLVVGVGGGVAMDVATAVAHRTDALLAVVPTIASTDAPTSTVAVVYDETGNFLEVLHRDRNPELVLVDTAVVASAPVRFLAHGMGDAMATHFEARAVAASGGKTDAGGRSAFAAVDIAEQAYCRVEDHGADALAAVERNAVTPAVERIVEANTLLSGLGFESAGTAGAHAIQTGLTNVGVREPHGLLVAFGTVVELLVQDRSPEVLDAALEVVFDVGLDVTLDEIGVTDDELARVGELACEHGMEQEPVDPSPERVADAVRTADEFVHRRRDGT